MKSSECEGYKSREICDTCNAANHCALQDWAEEVAPGLAREIAAYLDEVLLKCAAENKELPDEVILNLSNGEIEY